MVPIIIGFLASAIGLGGIGQKIRQIIETLQKPVNKALDFVIKTGLKLAAPIIRGIKGISGKVKAKVAAGKAWVKGKVEAGKAWAKKKYESGKAWVRGKVESGRKKLSGDDSGIKKLPPDVVKKQALDKAVMTIRARKPGSIAEFHKIIGDIRKSHLPLGLKTLDARVKNDTSMGIEISASASPPEQRDISWKEAFKGAARLRKRFEKQGQTTHAALSVNGVLLGKGSSNVKGHAEMNLVRDLWVEAEKRIRWHQARGNEGRLVLAINRTPCSECGPGLAAKLQGALAANVSLRSASFILAPTGVYEPTVPIDTKEIEAERERIARELGKPASEVDDEVLKEEFDKGDKGMTTTQHLAQLAASGWDIRQLDARRVPKAGVPSPKLAAAEILAEYCHKLAQRFNRK
jgi:hypothetical protein